MTDLRKPTAKFEWTRDQVKILIMALERSNVSVPAQASVEEFAAIKNAFNTVSRDLAQAMNNMEE